MVESEVVEENESVVIDEESVGVSDCIGEDVVVVLVVVVVADSVVSVVVASVVVG